MAGKNACDIHNRSLDLYCSTDDQFICVECQFSPRHESHKFDLASRVLERKSSVKTEGIDKAIEALEARRRQIIKQGKTVTQDIQEEINVIINKKLDILEEQQKEAEAAKRNIEDSNDINASRFQPIEEADIKFTKKEEIRGSKCGYIGELKSSYSTSIAASKSSPIIETKHIPFNSESMRKKGKPVKTISDLKYPWGIAVSPDGQVVVAENLAHRITILNKDGKKVKSFGTKGKKDGEITHPYGIAISHDGHILVTDNHRLQKLTFDGEFVQSVGSSKDGTGELEFCSPKGIAVHPTTGQIFIAERDNDRIQVLNSDLTFSHKFGSNKSGPDQLKDPCGVAIDKDGYVYVAGYYNYCIKKFKATGEYIHEFSSQGSEPGELKYPTSVAIDINNQVYVTECGNHRVSIFDSDGSFKYSFGGYGSGEGEFEWPYCLTLDTDGNLYVSDSSNHRVVYY